MRCVVTLPTTLHKLRMIHEKPDCGGLDLAVLQELRLELVRWRRGSNDSSASLHRGVYGDGMPKLDLRPRRHSRNARGKQTVGHRCIQKQGHNPAVEAVRIPLERGTALERGADASVIVLLKPQAQTVRTAAAAHQARRMIPMTQSGCGIGCRPGRNIRQTKRLFRFHSFRLPPHAESFHLTGSKHAYFTPTLQGG